MKKLKTPHRVRFSGSANEDDYDEGIPVGPVGYYLPPKEPDALVIYIYDAIGADAEYINLVHTLRYATEDMEINMHISSPGGNLSACLAIINAMSLSAANVITILDGEASSAAAMIWLAGHERVVSSRHVKLMLHGASCGYGYSKVSDIINGTQAITDTIEALLDDLTEGVLTEEERVDIRKGRDIYLTGTQLIERMSNEQETDEK